MEMKHGTHITLPDLFLIISAAEECQEKTLYANRRLNYIRDISPVFLIVKVGQILS